MRNSVEQHTHLMETKEQKQQACKSVRRKRTQFSTIFIFRVYIQYTFIILCYCCCLLAVVVFILVGFRSGERVNEGYLSLN